MKESKFKKSIEKFDPEISLNTDEALKLITSQPRRKFLESVDVAVRLGIDPKKSDQNVRGSVTLPNSLGKEVKVAVFVGADKADEAKSAGADFVGSEDLIEKYSKDPIDFDVAITTPSMMKEVSKLAKILGPKDSPKPKSGTVTENIEKAVKDIKHGQSRFKADKDGTIHGTVANIDMDQSQITENLELFIAELKRLKPASSKGIYIKRLPLDNNGSRV